MRYDVIVIGLGPAGAAFTYFTSKYGIKILALEKNPDFALKPCGELVPKELFSILNIKPEEIHAYPIRRVVIYFHYENKLQEKIVEFDSAEGYSIDKKSLLKLLVDLASNENVNAMLNKPVILLSKDGKAYVKGSNIYEGRYIICCDGLNGISTKFFKPKTIVATYQKRITNITLPYDEASFAIIFSDIKGYGWVIPKANGVVNVGFGGLNVNPKVVLERMMKILPWLRNGKTLQEAGAPIPVSGLIDKPISDKLIAIGDIAGSVFPLSGEGIRPSIIMAKYISQAVVNALEYHDDSLISEGITKFIHEWGYRIKRSLTYLKIYKRMPPQIIKRAISRVNSRILRKILDGEFPTSIMVKFG